MKYIKFLFLFVFCIAFTGLRDHLKPALNKQGNHSMRNIDFLYVINLDPRPEKWEKTKNQFKKYRIYPYRFSAVNGWELSKDDINDVGVKFTDKMRGNFMGTSYLTDDFKPTHSLINTYGQTYFAHCTARGTIGIALSHISVLYDAYQSGYETIWVMEDDVELVQNPHILSDLIEQLDKYTKKNWDMLFTDRDTRGKDGKYVSCTASSPRPNFIHKNNYAYKRNFKHFRQIGARYGAYSVIYRRRGIKKILDFFFTYSIFLPYDMDFALPPGIVMFGIKKGIHDVVRSFLDAPSDNGGAFYLNDENP